MQTGYFNYAFNVRGKCNIARKIFSNIALSPKYSENDGSPYAKYTNPVFSALINPLEYSYGNVFIAGNANGCRPFNITTSGSVVPTKTYPTIFLDNNPTLHDMRGATFLRGYLQPMTLADYCTAANLKQTATRVYLTAWQNQDTNYATHLTAVLGADKKVLNEYEEYSGKIVPVITWYYTNADGERVSDRQNISIAYLFSANHSKQGYWKQYNVPLSGGTEWRKVTDTVSYGTILFGVCAPYVSSVTSSNAGKCAPLNGYAYSNKYGDDMRTTIELNENPLYTLLSVGYTSTSAASSTSDYFNITGGVFDGKYGANRSTFFDYSAKYIPVFNSVNEIVDMFEDFGVVVTTNWDEVLNPTPTPEETATPNPDPTDREIPNFPDNTTDNTPIEPAYITPSTFGQSCVYTPTTTRDFLTWVCDSTVDIGNWARLFANPADVITGINLYNLDIVAHDSAHVEAKTETNILGVTTPIPNYTILGGYNNIVDGGTLHLQAYYGNYADFTSMTYQLYVPFVGFTTLRACDVVNKTLHLYYAVDFATGSAVAFVNSDDKLIYTSPCTVAGKIPLSTSDRNSQMINNTLSVLGGLSGLLGGVASGNVGGGVGALMGGLGGLQMQTNYSNKGSLSSVNIYKLIPAFIERTRYDLFLPSNDSAYINARYQTAAGAPSTQFDTLLNCVDAGGFVQSDVVYLTSQTATETEKQQIIDLIKSGIYL